MKKQLIGTIAGLAFACSTAQAVDFTGVESASIGYLSPARPLTIGFYGQAGQNLVFGMLNQEYSSTVGFCGLGSYINPEALYFTHYTNQFVSATLPVNDLYVYVCLHADGASGDVMEFAIAQEAFQSSAAGKSITPAKRETVVDPTLEKQLIEQIKAELSKLPG